MFTKPKPVRNDRKRTPSINLKHGRQTPGVSETPGVFFVYCQDQDGELSQRATVETCTIHIQG